MSVTLVTRTLESIPARGVVILNPAVPTVPGAVGDVGVDVAAVDGTVIATVNAWRSGGLDVSAHLTPEAARRFAADLLTAARAAEKER